MSRDFEPARKVNRKRREKLNEKDPEAYQQELEKGRERAHQFYVKKIKAVHPNAKVGAIHGSMNKYDLTKQSELGFICPGHQ